MAGARVRFFCVVGPRGDHYADIGYRYFKAVTEWGVPVRGMPIGAMFLDLPSDSRWRHWKKLREYLAGPVAERFVNIVCAPLNFPMGSAVTTASLPRNIRPATREELLYEPGTAFQQLWTAGRRNIAIAAAPPHRRQLTDEELESLKRYDLVLAADEVVEQLIPTAPMLQPEALQRIGMTLVRSNT